MGKSLNTPRATLTSWVTKRQNSVSAREVTCVSLRDIYAFVTFYQ